MTAGKSKSTVLEKIRAFLQTLEPSFAFPAASLPHPSTPSTFQLFNPSTSLPLSLEP